MKSKLFKQIEIRPITDEASYQTACDSVEKLMDMGEQGQPEAEAARLAYLDALATLIEAYEKKHFAFNQTELTLVQVIRTNFGTTQPDQTRPRQNTRLEPRDRVVQRQTRPFNGASARVAPAIAHTHRFADFEQTPLMQATASSAGARQDTACPSYFEWVTPFKRVPAAVARTVRP